jgi:hypothetical protein
VRACLLLAFVVSLVLLAGNLFASSCGPDQTATAPPFEKGGRLPTVAPSTTSTGEQTIDRPTSTPTTPRPRSVDNEVANLFIQLSRELAPLPVYGLVQLPPQASIPGEWWPILQIDSPAVYDGPQIANPQVSNSPAGSQEAQVLLRMNEGWLMIIENFRGDLGDVRGISAGEVGGRPATMYELPGGTLVQWSHGGAWYGVFGRGVEADVVVTIAQALRIISPTD